MNHNVCQRDFACPCHLSAAQSRVDQLVSLLLALQPLDSFSVHLLGHLLVSLLLFLLFSLGLDGLDPLLMYGIRPLLQLRKDAPLAYLSHLLLLILQLLFLRLYLCQQSALLRPFFVRLEPGCRSEGLLWSMPLLALDRNVSLVVTRKGRKGPYHSCACPEASRPEAPAPVRGWLCRTYWQLAKCRDVWMSFWRSITVANFTKFSAGQKKLWRGLLRAVRKCVAGTPLPHIRCGLTPRVLELPTL